METLFLYLLKASGLITLFFLAYYFLLRKETFFKSNRWFLLLGLVSSVILPLVTFRKVVWVDPAPKQHLDWSQLPVNTSDITATESFEINWLLVAGFVYAIGIIIFLFKFFFDFSHLIRTLKGKTVLQQADFKFVDVSEKVSPFSYFNYIVYNSSLYSADELENIIEHEKVHCGQNHSADVLFTRFFCILFWYNPFIWLYQKAILQNLEFIADSEALKNIKDKKAYQFTLLKVTTHDNCVAITNHFYQSLIKKRIIMLNKNQSKKWNSWKYSLIIPVLIGFMLYFQVKVIAQEKNYPDLLSNAIAAETVTMIVDKNSTDGEIKKEAASIKEKYGITLKFSKIKRNSAGEIIAIKATYKDANNKSGTYQVNGDEPIKPLRFFRNDNGAIGFGNSKQVHVFSTKNSNNNSDDNSDGNEITSTITVTDDVEAPEPPEPPQNADTIEAPEPPMPNSRNYNSVIVKRTKDDNGKVSVTVNGETIDVDVDKLIDEATANLDFNFDFDFDSSDFQGSDAEVKAHLQKMKSQLEKIRPKMEKARMKMERLQPLRSETQNSRREIEQARREVEQSKREIEQSKREIENSQRNLERAKRDLELQKAQFEKAKKNN